MCIRCKWFRKHRRKLFKLWNEKKVEKKKKTPQRKGTIHFKIIFLLLVAKAHKKDMPREMCAREEKKNFEFCGRPMWNWHKIIYVYIKNKEINCGEKAVKRQRISNCILIFLWQQSVHKSFTELNFISFSTFCLHLRLFLTRFAHFRNHFGHLQHKHSFWCTWPQSIRCA